MAACKKASLWIFAILFLVLAIVSLVAVVGLAAASFVFAQIADERYVVALNNSHDDFEDIWLFFMIAASVVVLVYCIFGCLAVILLVEAIRSSKNHKKRQKPKPKHHFGFHFPLSKKSENEEEMVDEAASPVGDIHEHGIDGRIDTIKGVPLVHFTGAPLAPVSFGAVVAVFLSLLFSAVALLCVFWGIAIAYNNARRVDKDVWPYILVEVVVGLVMPILVIFSAIVFSVYLEYTTQGSIDARVIITRLLPVIKLLKGEKYDYWSILDRFYFQLSLHDSEFRNGKPSSCQNMCSKSPSTWIITIIVSLAFLLSVSYFMNTNITSQVTLRRCPPQIGPEMDCFNTSSFLYVDCTNDDVEQMNFTSLHCFRFLRFGRDSDVIGGLSRAFAFYLATLAFFTTAFHIANVLINFQPSRLWGLGFMIIGVLLFIGGVAVMLTEEAVLLRLDVIKIFQFYMVAMFVVLVGLLLVISKWWERVPGTKNGLVSPGFIAHKKEEKDVEEQIREHAL